MNNTHTLPERYYQQVRSRQKRDTFSGSLLLLVNFAAGSPAEFTFTIWHFAAQFFDYLFETLPTPKYRRSVLPIRAY